MGWKEEEDKGRNEWSWRRKEEREGGNKEGDKGER